MKKYLTLFYISAVLLFSGCTHLLYLDSAMDYFNQGANLENQLRFQPEAGASASPTMYYSMAYSGLNKALEKQKEELRKDHVLGSTYTVKALCEWKLKLYDKAIQSADAAVEELLAMDQATGIKMPRDMALMEALPALIEVEKAKESLFSLREQTEATLEEARSYYVSSIFDPDAEKAATLEQAIKKIGEIQKKARGNDELSVYFVQSQLAGLKTWSDAIDLLRQKEKGLDEASKREAQEFRKAQRDQFLEPEKGRLLERLGSLLPPGEPGGRLIDYWKKII
ncbi:MAG: hypothetical protein KDC66_20320 [Phaeodactylibacter sp.]|nr:hypothetical protein [Phaeodactylibacter sp.]MCB9276644.1 hypothetical protein [Lewinellaceae bacterium]